MAVEDAAAEVEDPDDVRDAELVLVSVVVRLEVVSVEVSVVADPVVDCVVEPEVDGADDEDPPHVATQYASPASMFGQLGGSTAGFHSMNVETLIP